MIITADVGGQNAQPLDVESHFLIAVLPKKRMLVSSTVAIQEVDRESMVSFLRGELEPRISVL